MTSWELIELEIGVEGRVEGGWEDEDENELGVDKRESPARPSFVPPTVPLLAPRLWALQIVFVASRNFVGWTLKSNTSKTQPNSPGCDEYGGHTTLNP